MDIRSYKSEAIVLNKKNYSEADRILTVYSKNYGKMSLMAKGVRRMKSRKRGSLEVFNKIYFSAVKGHGMDVVTEVELVESLSDLRTDAKKMSVAYFFVEVASRLTREGEKNEGLYDLLLNYLINLKDTNSLKILRYDFIHDTLTCLGFWPVGKKIDDPDRFLEQIIEGKLSSRRVGKKVLSAE